MHPFADEEDTWLAVADAFSLRQLAYVHLSDQETLGAEAIPAGFVDRFRKRYHGRLVLAGGFEKDTAQAALDAGRADLIAIGRPFIANPDLVERYRNGWPVAVPDRSLFYTGGKRDMWIIPLMRTELMGEGRRHLFASFFSPMAEEHAWHHRGSVDP